MAEYRDIVTFRPRPGGKPFGHKIGSARVNDDGTIDMYFDSQPLTTLSKDGTPQVHARISPKQDKGGFGGGRTEPAPPRRATPKDDDFEDGIPF